MVRTHEQCLQYQREYSKKNRDKILKYNKEYYRKNKYMKDKKVKRRTIKINIDFKDLSDIKEPKKVNKSKLNIDLNNLTDLKKPKNLKKSKKNIEKAKKIKKRFYFKRTVIEDKLPDDFVETSNGFVLTID